MVEKMTLERKLHIQALVNRGYYKPDLKGMPNDKLRELYFKEVNKYIMELSEARKYK